MGGPLLLKREKQAEELSALRAKISKRNLVDIAIDRIKTYAVKQWGREGAGDVLKMLDQLGQEIKNCRDNKVGTEKPWDFGEAGLASKVKTTLNTFMKEYKLKATQDGTTVSIAYYGPPPTKRIEMDG